MSVAEEAVMLGKTSFAVVALALLPATVHAFDHELGAPAPAGGAWTGSDATGAWAGDDCDGWTNATAAATGMTGSAARADAVWGGGDAHVRCDGKAALVCFQE